MFSQRQRSGARGGGGRRYCCFERGAIPARSPRERHGCLAGRGDRQAWPLALGRDGRAWKESIEQVKAGKSIQSVSRGWAGWRVPRPREFWQYLAGGAGGKPAGGPESAHRWRDASFNGSGRLTRGRAWSRLVNGWSLGWLAGSAGTFACREHGFPASRTAPKLPMSLLNPSRLKYKAALVRHLNFASQEPIPRYSPCCVPVSTRACTVCQNALHHGHCCSRSRAACGLSGTLPCCSSRPHFHRIRNTNSLLPPLSSIAFPRHSRLHVHTLFSPDPSPAREQLH